GGDAGELAVKWQDKVDWAFDDVWEKRKVYVIEGTSKLPQYAYSKRVLFIDKESWGIPYSDIYDRSGELWKIWINDVSFRKSVPGSNAITYDDEMPFAPAIVMVDMQLEHATKASLPSPRFPGEQGWYYHQGEKAGVTDDWFTVAPLSAAGRGPQPARFVRARLSGAPPPGGAPLSVRAERFRGALHVARRHPEDGAVEPRAGRDRLRGDDVDLRGRELLGHV